MRSSVTRRYGLRAGLISTLLLVGIPAAISLQDAFAGGGKLPGSSIADARLQQDVAQQVAMLEMIFGKGCNKSRIVNTEIIEPPARVNVDPWVERWTADRCGTKVYYQVKLVPSKGGGTDYGVSLMEDPAGDAQPEAGRADKPVGEEVPVEATPPKVPPN
jgi:hypothetical protein